MIFRPWREIRHLREDLNRVRAAYVMNMELVKSDRAFLHAEIDKLQDRLRFADEGQPDPYSTEPAPKADSKLKEHRNE